MNCPICKSDDIIGKYVDFLNSDHFTCVACESTWLANDGVIDEQNITPGSAHRALRNQISQDAFKKAFNDPDGWLNKTLQDIAAGLDTDSWSAMYELPEAPVKFLGEEKVYDFYVQNEYTIFIFHPTNAKGLNWCYAHLPEDCPRWGLNGYVVESRYIDDIVAGAERDGLVSKEAEENFQDESRRSI